MNRPKSGERVCMKNEIEHVLVSVAGAPGVVVTGAEVVDAFVEADAPLVREEPTPEEPTTPELLAGNEVAMEELGKSELVVANELELEDPRKVEPVAGAELVAEEESRNVEPVASEELTPELGGSEVAASEETVRRSKAQRADNLELRMRAMASRSTAAKASREWDREKLGAAWRRQFYSVHGRSREDWDMWLTQG